MIKIGKEYIFNFHVLADSDETEDAELLRNNTGMSCKVIDDMGEKFWRRQSLGHLYEVEFCNGSKSFAYGSELTELKM